MTKQQKSIMFFLISITLKHVTIWSHSHFRFLHPFYDTWSFFTIPGCIVPVTNFKESAWYDEAFFPSQMFAISNKNVRKFFLHFCRFLRVWFLWHFMSNGASILSKQSSWLIWFPKNFFFYKYVKIKKNSFSLHFSSIYGWRNCIFSIFNFQ